MSSGNRCGLLFRVRVVHGDRWDDQVVRPLLPGLAETRAVAGLTGSHENAAGGVPVSADGELTQVWDPRTEQLASHAGSGSGGPATLMGPRDGRPRWPRTCWAPR